jgi:MFS family permease
MVLQPEEAGRATSGRDDAGRGRQIRLAAVASVIGTSIEWYDFFLYGTAAAIVFPAVFFPASSAYAGTLESFATYAVGFAARPVGAAIFGHWGDRIGRKATLIITLLLMGIASALVGVLPGTNTIGVAAPILLVVLRVLQGVAVGGEWSGSVLLSMEWGKQNKRGLMASWPQIGVPIGLLLGTGMMTLIALAAPDAFKAWAWRIPFLASLVLVAIGLWVRLKVMETPLFAQLVKKQTVSKVPVLDVIRRYPKQIVLSALLRMSEQAPFYLYTAFALAYIKDHLHKSTYVGLAAVTVGGALELFLIPTFGSLSDRLGRRRVYTTGAIVMGIVAFPFFLLLNTATLGFIILGTALIAFAHSMQYGPQSSYIAESFPTGLAYAGSGLGYQAASLIAGGPAPLLATWMLPTFGWQAIAVYIIACVVITLFAAALLPTAARSTSLRSRCSNRPGGPPEADPADDSRTRQAALAVYAGGRVRLAVTRPRRSSRCACAAVSVTAKIRIWPLYWSQGRDQVSSPASCQGVEPGRRRIAASSSASRLSWCAAMASTRPGRPRNRHSCAGSTSSTSRSRVLASESR